MFSSFTSTSEVSASHQSPYRNFRCTEPGCGASYVRKEHLNRHRKQHQQQIQAYCEHCGHAFSRSDILRRHQKLHHNDVTVGRTRALQACDHCHSRRTRCKGMSPCDACVGRGIQCTFRRRAEGPDQTEGGVDENGTLERSFEAGGATAVNARLPNRQASIPEVSLKGNLDLWETLQQHKREHGNPGAVTMLDKVEMTDALDEGIVHQQDPSHGGPASELDLQRHVDGYFAKFHGQWPLLHWSSFRQEAEPQFLVLSMVMISLWISGDARAQAAAVQIHERFVVLLQEQRDIWDASRATPGNEDAVWPMGIYQSILLHVIFAMMRGSPAGNANRSRPRLPLAIHELLDTLVKSCLRQGVFHYPKMIEQYSHVDLSFLMWLRVEEAKRFAILLFKVWQMCYGTSSSVRSGSASRQLSSVSSLRFPLPESRYLWDAETIRDFIRRRDEELREGTEVREEEQFWISNLGIENLRKAKSWRELTM